MREHRRCEPVPIGKEVSQGKLLKDRIFDIADNKLDDHTAVLGAIRIEGSSTQIGKNDEISPVGPQFASFAKQVPSISCDTRELTARTAKTIATYASANPTRRNNSACLLPSKESARHGFAISRPHRQSQGSQMSCRAPPPSISWASSPHAEHRMPTATSLRPAQGSTQPIQGVSPLRTPDLYLLRSLGLSQEG